MVDAGRLRLACPSPLSTDAFARGIAMFQVVAHGNKYGATFAASPEGFVMSLEKDIQTECRAYLKRKVEAIDQGHGATHVEIDAVKIHKTVSLAGVAHQISLSHDELHLAVAYGSNLALFEVATIINSVGLPCDDMSPECIDSHVWSNGTLQSSPEPYQTFEGLKVEQIAWRSVAETEELTLAVVTSDKRVVVCRTDGSQDSVRPAGSAAAVCWSPTGEQFAIGTTEATVDVFGLSTLEHERTIERPDCCDEGFEGQ
ncbi:hypothetical protein PINS_up004105 [Pythium insidiosum]|nr:hypothetical protein PINS_up004105 [Pythium insidiosum]